MTKRRKKYEWKGQHDGEKSGVYLPDAETIRKAAAKIRAGWDTRSPKNRRRLFLDQDPVELTEIRVADLGR